MTATTSKSAAVPPPNPVHVPGYGWVAWPRELLDAQARYLTYIHRPDHAPAGGRMRRWFRIGAGRPEARKGPALCIFCGVEWACPEGMWARGWLSSRVRLRERCRPRHRGRRVRATHWFHRVGWMGRMWGSGTEVRSRRREHDRSAPVAAPGVRAVRPARRETPPLA